MGYDRRTLLRTVAATGVAALAGCSSGSGGGSTSSGNGGSSGSTDTDTETPTSTPTATQGGSGATTAQKKYPDYNWDLLKQAEPTETTTIEMTENLRFKPTIAKVSKGATVTWKNPSFKHSLAIPALDVKRTVAGGEKTTVTVDQTGTFDYVCTLHPPKMLGRLVVTE